VVGEPKKEKASTKSGCFSILELFEDSMVNGNDQVKQKTK
jgi:hypothetical protein